MRTDFVGVRSRLLPAVYDSRRACGRRGMRLALLRAVPNIYHLFSHICLDCRGDCLEPSTPLTCLFADAAAFTMLPLRDFAACLDTARTARTGGALAYLLPAAGDAHYNRN